MGARVSNDTTSKLLYRIVRVLAWIFMRLVCRCRVSGQEHLPMAGPLLIVANHLSWYDPILFIAILPRRIWFFTKVEVLRWPVVGWFARHTGQIFVERGEGDRAALEKALAYLQEGKVLVIFPEGTVARQEKMIPAHSGIAMLALRSGATVLPIAHSGTRRVLRWGRGLFPRVTVKIGQPYVPEVPEGVARKAAYLAVTNEVMGQIAMMLPPEQRGVFH